MRGILSYLKATQSAFPKVQKIGGTQISCFRKILSKYFRKALLSEASELYKKYGHHQFRKTVEGDTGSGCRRIDPKLTSLKTEQKKRSRSLSRTVTFLDKEVGDVLEAGTFPRFLQDPLRQSSRSARTRFSSQSRSSSRISRWVGSGRKQTVSSSTSSISILRG